MKKILICALALLLLLGAALAEATPGEIEAGALPDGAAEAVDGEPTAPPGIAFDAAGAGYEGVWVPFEDGFMLYLPAHWRSFELTDAQKQAGLFYRAGSDDSTMGVAVSFFPAGSIATLEALEDDFGGAGFAALERRQVNGLWALGFTRPEEDCRGEAFFHPAYPDYVLTVYVTPLGEDGSTAAAMGRAILDSLSPAPME